VKESNSVVVVSSSSEFDAAVGIGLVSVLSDCCDAMLEGSGATVYPRNPQFSSKLSKML
jgi:hypothetical protein